MAAPHSTGSRQPETYEAVTGSGRPETDSSYPHAHGSGLAEGGSTHQHSHGSGLAQGGSTHQHGHGSGFAETGSTHPHTTGGGLPETRSTGAGLRETGSSYPNNQSQFDSNNYSKDHHIHSSSGFTQNDETHRHTGNTTNRLPETGSTYPTTQSDSISYSSTHPHGSSGVGQNDGTQHRGSTIPAKPTNYSDESNPLNEHHRPSAGLHGQQGVDALPGDTTIRRAGIAQNAPGKLGETGENIVGGLGFGGSAVERPKEDQGLGEKIANFLGA